MKKDCSSASLFLVVILFIRAERLLQFQLIASGLEKSTRPLVFTSASGCRASETLDNFQCRLNIFSIYANNICDAGQVPILRYIKACALRKRVCNFFELCPVVQDAMLFLSFFYFRFGSHFRAKPFVIILVDYMIMILVRNYSKVGPVVQ